MRIKYSNYIHVVSCWPKIANNPDILSIYSDATGDTTIDFSIEFATTGLSLCQSMEALVEIFNDQTQEILYSAAMDNSTVMQYQDVSGIITATGIKQAKACFIVKVTLSNKDNSSAVAKSSNVVCFQPVCELTDPKITFVSHKATNDSSSYIWTFDTSVSSNTHC